MRHALTLCLMLAACNFPEPYEDIGTACLGYGEPWSSERLLVIDGSDSTSITVILSGCVSGSVEWLDQTCTASVDGDQVVVTTSGKTKTPGTQTKDCQTILQDCGTVELTEGDWTLVYGQAEEAFTVPYEGDAICAAN